MWYRRDKVKKKQHEAEEERKILLLAGLNSFSSFPLDSDSSSLKGGDS